MGLLPIRSSTTVKLSTDRENRASVHHPSQGAAITNATPDRTRTDPANRPHAGVRVDRPSAIHLGRTQPAPGHASFSSAAAWYLSPPGGFPTAIPSADRGKMAIVHDARNVHPDPRHRQHDHGAGDHGHSHGLVDDSIKRSREGVRAVARSLAVLGLATALQAVVFAASHSIALLADLIHNGGDSLTAVPLGIAFLLRSARAERYAGLAVVAAIFISAAVAATEAVERLVHPEHAESSSGAGRRRA